VRALLDTEPQVVILVYSISRFLPVAGCIVKKTRGRSRNGKKTRDKYEVDNFTCISIFERGGRDCHPMGASFEN